MEWHKALKLIPKNATLYIMWCVQLDMVLTENNIQLVCLLFSFDKDMLCCNP